MKKIILCCLGAMTSISTGVAQKVTAQWGEDVKASSNLHIRGTLGVKNGKLLLLTGASDYFRTTTVDTKTMKVLETNGLEVATKKTMHISAAIIKGKKWLFTRNTADKVGYVKGYPIKIGRASCRERV